MKKTKSLLRLWITGVSVAGFIFGWATFAHSNQAGSSAIIQSPASATILSGQTTANTISSSSSQTTLQTFPTFGQSQSSSTRLRTGGS